MRFCAFCRSLCTAVLGLCIATAAYADSPSAIAKAALASFHSDRFRFNLKYPESFELVAQPEGAAAVALRDRAEGYPTFNIVVESGSSFPSWLSLDSHAQRLLEEYRRVGLTTASLEFSESLPIGEFQALRFGISYQGPGGSFSAVVTQIPTGNFLYTLTFIDRAQGKPRESQALKELLDSFQSEESPLPNEAASSLHATGPRNYFLLALGGVLILFFCALALRRRRRIKPS